MPSDDTYNPDALKPWLAGLGAGGVAAIVGTFLAFVLRSPDEVIANSLTVAVGALLIGLASGLLWRRLRATKNGLATFRLALLGGFITALVGIAIVDQVALSNLIPYAVPIAGMIFLTVAFLTPTFASMVISVWLAITPALFALVLGVALFGRGNVESGELSLSDLTTTTATVTSSADGVTPTVAAGPAVFVISEGTATYTIPETLRGLRTVAVGRSEELTGTITPGEGFTFTLDLTSFVSDQRRRDGFVRDMFGPDPSATFTSDSFELPDVPDGQVVMMTVGGTMTINGTSRDVTWTVEARKDGAVVSVTGELDILLTDFGVTPPSLAFVQVENEAHLEILFQADAA